MEFNYKTASKKELENEYNRIADKQNNGQFLTKKELKYLPEILQDGEQVLGFTSGLMGGNTWLITLTNRKIIFLDKGMLFGLKQETIPLNRINAVSGSTGIFFGKIVITDGAKDREITNVWKKTVTVFINKCQEAIFENSQAKENPYKKLENLASLKEKGIINKDEFESEKKKILATIL